MYGIVRTTIRAIPAIKNGIIPVRGIKTLPPKTPLTGMEKSIGLTAIFVGCLVIPGYIMSNLEAYKAREE